MRMRSFTLSALSHARGLPHVGMAERALRPRDVACYMFNGLCGRGSEAEWEACRSVDLEGVVNVPVLMIYVCTVLTAKCSQ